MDNDLTKDLIIGMLCGLQSNCKCERTEDQTIMIKRIFTMIDEIYYKSEAKNDE